MLARIGRIPGLDSLEVDHTGTYLRLGADSADVVNAALAVLRLEGYEAVLVDPGEAALAEKRIDAWYSEASDLSREEARTIAAQALQRSGVDRSTPPAERLSRAMADTLYRSFTAEDASSNAGRLIERVLPRLEADARRLLPEEQAEKLVAVLSAWRSR